eukprot:299818-Prorocentrum_minimum.AAC.1
MTTLIIKYAPPDDHMTIYERWLFVVEATEGNTVAMSNIRECSLDRRYSGILPYRVFRITGIRGHHITSADEARPPVAVDLRAVVCDAARGAVHDHLPRVAGGPDEGGRHPRGDALRRAQQEGTGQRPRGDPRLRGPQHPPQAPWIQGVSRGSAGGQQGISRGSASGQQGQNDVICASVDPNIPLKHPGNK